MLQVVINKKFGDNNNSHPKYLSTKDSFTLQGTSGSKKYYYDILGQLTREDNTALDKTYLYVYNGNGNVTAKQIYSYTTAATSTLGTNYNQKIPYSYDSTHKDRLTSYDSKAISYNANGEVSSYDGWNYTWTRGKLTSVSKTLSSSGFSARAVVPPSFSNVKTYSYEYNALGQRVSAHYSYEPGSGISSVMDGEVTDSLKYDYRGRLLTERETKTVYGEGIVYTDITCLYDESSMVGMQYTRNATTSLYYFRRSPQGDVDAIYDSNSRKRVELTSLTTLNFSVFRRAKPCKVLTLLWLVTAKSIKNLTAVRCKAVLK